MGRTSTVAAKLTARTQTRLKRAAQEEGIGVSTLLSQIVTDYLRADREKERMNLSEQIQDAVSVVEDVVSELEYHSSYFEGLEAVNTHSLKGAVKELDDAADLVRVAEEERAARREELELELEEDDDEYNEEDED